MIGWLMTEIAKRFLPFVRRALAMTDLAISRMDELIEQTEALHTNTRLTRKESARLRDAAGVARAEAEALIEEANDARKRREKPDDRCA